MIIYKCSLCGMEESLHDSAITPTEVRTYRNIGGFVVNNQLCFQCHDKVKDKTYELKAEADKKFEGWFEEAKHYERSNR